MVFFAICNCIVAQMKTLQYLLININTDIHDKNIAFILDYHLKVEQCLISFNKIFFIIMNQLFLYYPIIICTLGFTVVTVSGNILEKKTWNCTISLEKIYFQATDRSIQIQMTVFTLAGTFGLFAFSYAADKVIQEVHNFLNKLRFRCRFLSLNITSTESKHINRSLLFKLVWLSNWFQKGHSLHYLSISKTISSIGCIFRCITFNIHWRKL